MMGENPNYRWSLNRKMSPPSDYHIQQPSPTFMSPPAVGGAAAAPPPASLFHPHQYLFGSSLLLPPTTNSDLDDDNHHDDVINQQDFPLSWSQLLMGGIGGDEGQMMMNPWLRTTWSRPINGVGEVIKQELQLDQTRHDQSSIYRDDDDHHNNFNNININDQDEDDDDENGSQVCSSSWSSHQIPSASSCVTSLASTNNILDFSTKRKQTNSDLHQCEDASSGGASKRARFQASTTQNPLSTCKTTASKKTRVQHSSSQPPLKIRKEKLGDRITALHQLVSPFGKTDTASVLFEATAHIRLLEDQIEALTSPYLKLRTTTVSASMRHQLSDGEVAEKDLRSRGLCLVPMTCIDHIANDSINGLDYWTPALGGSF